MKSSPVLKCIHGYGAFTAEDCLQTLNLAHHSLRQKQQSPSMEGLCCKTSIYY